MGLRCAASAQLEGGQLGQATRTIHTISQQLPRPLVVHENSGKGKEADWRRVETRVWKESRITNGGESCR